MKKRRLVRPHFTYVAECDCYLIDKIGVTGLVVTMAATEDAGLLAWARFREAGTLYWSIHVVNKWHMLFDPSATPQWEWV
jgi:hypothetical protein